MFFIEAKGLVYDYIKTDENGNFIKKRALDGVDFTIEKGKFTAIIGQNGSGKSTLAKNMNAILTPTEGSMLVDGMDISDAENIWKVRQKVAMVFQNPENQIVSAI
ncbi:MAG: ATP-binding cassette domain-containing protein, partial [Firmicutes bacterium]|nr:ATP-binding cassette domain-containing protein [Bacillota bacterium]